MEIYVYGVPVNGFGSEIGYSYLGESEKIEVTRGETERLISEISKKAVRGTRLILNRTSIGEKAILPEDIRLRLIKMGLGRDLTISLH